MSNKDLYVVSSCDECGEDIYEGDQFYDLSDIVGCETCICEECMNAKFRKEARV